MYAFPTVLRPFKTVEIRLAIARSYVKFRAYLYVLRSKIYYISISSCFIDNNYWLVRASARVFNPQARARTVLSGTPKARAAALKEVYSPAKKAAKVSLTAGFDDIAILRYTKHQELLYKILQDREVTIDCGSRLRSYTIAQLHHWPAQMNTPLTATGATFPAFNTPFPSQPFQPLLVFKHLSDLHQRPVRKQNNMRCHLTCYFSSAYLDHNSQTPKLLHHPG